MLFLQDAGPAEVLIPGSHFEQAGFTALLA